MSWTDERVETLKRMWVEGQSASQIAKELGGVTRNAVIGKVHRLGLSNRDEDEAEVEPAPEAAPPPKASAKVAAAPPPPPPPPPAAPLSAAASIIASATGPIPLRKSIVPAGQPLPPQPSANEISPEALASVREVEKRAARLTLMELTERTFK